MIKILANDGIDQLGKKKLTDAGFEIITEKITQDVLASKVNEFDALLVRSATKVNKGIIDAGTRLKLVGRGGVGLDNIDVTYAEKKGIKVVNTPEASSISVAELVFSHLFGIVRFIHQSNRAMPHQGQNRFNDLKKEYANGTELRGKTIGIIGLGRIGREVAKIALGIGMDVLAYDIYPCTAEIVLEFPQQLSVNPVKFKITTISKNDVLANSDFISLHIPLDKGNPPVISKKEFEIMKNGAGIVNCSRGGTINEQDLLEALNNGRVSYAGLDVFENEPSPIANLLNHPNVSLTPHIGASTVEAQQRIGIELADKVISFFKNTSTVKV